MIKKIIEFIPTNKKHIEFTAKFLHHEAKRVLFNKNFLMEIDITNQCELKCTYCYHFRYLDVIKEFQRYLEVTGQDLDEWAELYLDAIKEFQKYLRVTGQNPDDLAGQKSDVIKEFQRYLEVTGQNSDEWLKRYFGTAKDFQKYLRVTGQGLNGWLKRYSYALKVPNQSVDLLKDIVLKINKPEPSLEEWIWRLNGAYEKGVRVVLFVGGEPSLRQDVLMEANKIFSLLAVISNGVKKIPEEFQHRIAISLDGNREINDKFRGKGVFDKIMKNYQGDKRVVFNHVLTKEHYHNVSEIVQIAKDADVAGVVFDLYSPGINEESEFVISREERERIRVLLYRELRENGDMIFMTKQMVDWLVDGNHVKNCFWRENTYHYDVYGNERKCFNNFADCSRCGCVMGSFQNFVWSSAWSPKLRKFFLL